MIDVAEMTCKDIWEELMKGTGSKSISERVDEIAKDEKLTDELSRIIAQKYSYEYDDEEAEKALMVLAKLPTIIIVYVVTCIIDNLRLAPSGEEIRNIYFSRKPTKIAYLNDFDPITSLNYTESKSRYIWCQKQIEKHKIEEDYANMENPFEMVSWYLNDLRISG